MVVAVQDVVGMHSVGLGIEDIRTLIVAFVVEAACTVGHVVRGLVKKPPTLENLTAACDIQAVGRVVAACGQLP